MSTPEPVVVSLLADAAPRLVRTVDGLEVPDLAAPSLLPGWSRAHVVAHLTLNGEALTEVLRGVVAGEPVPMYASQEQRDADIEELAGRVAEEGSAELRTRLLATTTLFAEAVESVPQDAWDSRVERVPGGSTFRAASVPGMRLREIEIHHVDLDADYTRHDWSPAFCGVLLDAMTRRGEWPEPFVADPVDLDGTWAFGAEEGRRVTGRAADLGWWLTGRGGEGVAAEDGGDLPVIPTW